ncbi:hypothetical protein WA158_007863 [Blastocystis sp. Blastoise]
MNDLFNTIKNSNDLPKPRYSLPTTELPKTVSNDVLQEYYDQLLKMIDQLQPSDIKEIVESFPFENNSEKTDLNTISTTSTDRTYQQELNSFLKADYVNQKIPSFPGNPKPIFTSQNSQTKSISEDDFEKLPKPLQKIDRATLKNNKQTLQNENRSKSLFSFSSSTNITDSPLDKLVEKEKSADKVQNLRNNQKRNSNSTHLQNAFIRAAEIRKETNKSVLCRFYKLGMCRKNDCPYFHDPNIPKPLCNDFLNGNCQENTCIYSHDIHSFPCQFFHLFNNCSYGSNCRFSHEPIDALQLKQIKEDYEATMITKKTSFPKELIIEFTNKRKENQQEDDFDNDFI